MPCSQRAAPSTNNMAAANMAATNMAAVAIAMPPLLPAGQASASPPLGTHSPSPTSASLQTSAVTVLSPSMLRVSRGKGWPPWMLLPVGAVFHPSVNGPPRAPLCGRCKIPPQNIGPPPPQLGAGQHRMLKGSQAPGTAGKNPQLAENTHSPPFFNFVSKPKAHSSALSSSSLTHFFVFRPLSH